MNFVDHTQLKTTDLVPPIDHHNCCGSKAGPLRALFREYATASAAAAATDGAAAGINNNDRNDDDDFRQGRARRRPPRPFAELFYAARSDDDAGNKEQHYYADYYADWAPPSMNTQRGVAAHEQAMRRERDRAARRARAVEAEWCSPACLVHMLLDFHVLVPSSVPSPHDRRSIGSLFVVRPPSP